MKKENAVWLIAGGQMQTPLAITIKNLGYKLILTDGSVDCYLYEYADYFVHADIFDKDSNLNKCSLLTEQFNILACITSASDCHETVAVISNYLGLNGLDPKISKLCRHKNLTRELLTISGIYQPKSYCLSSFDDTVRAFEKMNCPAVLKATDNSGSRGFYRVNSKADLTTETFEHALRMGTSNKVIIEEALEPTHDEISELSVEVIWSEGKMFWLNWVDRLFVPDLQFFPSLHEYYKDKINLGVEIGHINPAQHSLAIKDSISDMIYSAGIALGMEAQSAPAILKADLMLTKKGPVILELTPRLSGGWDSSGSTIIRGGNFQEGVLRLALGEKLNLDFWNRYFEYKMPNIYASVLSEIPKDSKDCIGRKFSIGSDFNREASLIKALNNLKGLRYVL